MAFTEGRIERNPNVVARELAAESGAVLLHLDSGSYHGLNPLGWAIWGLIDGERSAQDVAVDLRRQFDDAPPELEADVQAFLDGLRERDLIR